MWKEKDDEVSGSTGVTYDYGFRIYDSRISKFLSVDPLTKSFPWWTPYQFAGNNPIKFIDMDGMEPLDPVEQWKKVGMQVVYKDGQVANLIRCSIQEQDYWVVKQGKKYIYTNKAGTKPWLPFHAYTVEEYRNNDAKSMIAFSNKAQETVVKTAVVTATMGIGSGGAVTSWLVSSTSDAIVDIGFQLVLNGGQKDQVNVISPLLKFIPGSGFVKNAIQGTLESTFTYTQKDGFQSTFLKGEQNISLINTSFNIATEIGSGYLKDKYCKIKGLNELTKKAADIGSEGLEQISESTAPKK